jgi:hypothetical protein
MKQVSLILLLLSPVFCFGQSITSSVRLPGGAELRSVIAAFKKDAHRVDTCQRSYICKIDGREWYGLDRGLDLPKNELVSLKLKVKGRFVNLPVAGMFNPNYSGRLSAKQFSLKSDRGAYMLYGYFSDGAGSYTAHWRVKGNRAERIVISTDESDFSWQGK